jgi:hypothetical protein
MEIFGFILHDNIKMTSKKFPKKWLSIIGISIARKELIRIAIIWIISVEIGR